MNALVAAWAHFQDLAVNQDDKDDFRRAIHEAQRILAGRIAVREYTDYWRP